MPYVEKHRNLNSFINGWSASMSLWLADHVFNQIIPTYHFVTAQITKMCNADKKNGVRSFFTNNFLLHQSFEISFVTTFSFKKWPTEVLLTVGCLWQQTALFLTCVVTECGHGSVTVQNGRIWKISLSRNLHTGWQDCSFWVNYPFNLCPVIHFCKFVSCSHSKTYWLCSQHLSSSDL